MAEQTSTKYLKQSLQNILKSEPQLYDLHTHLLGMGNAGFWVDTILMDPNIMPMHDDFMHHENIRHELCPLIWDQKDHTGFVDGEDAAKFFYHLVDNNILPVEENNILPVVENDTPLTQKNLSDVVENLKQNFSLVLCNLITTELNGELLHRGLNFKEDFSYDVVLTLSDLAKSLGIKRMDGIEFDQLAVTEKLIGYSSPGRVHFRDWIIFNARIQKFEIAFGIQVKELRDLITVNPDTPNEASKLARAHIINAFSMCDAQGTPARLVDFHSFHGSFTPEFYPRRFALKDSIYCQRLDVLAALIAHIIERYQTSLPPVKYCEFSVGVGDLSRPWVFDVLRSVRIYSRTAAVTQSRKDPTTHTYRATDDLSSFSQIVFKNHFPHLQTAFKGPERNSSETDGTSESHVNYKLLAGFNRQTIQAPLPGNQNEALRLLYDTPERAILIMIEEIIKSKNEASSSKKHTERQKITIENSRGPFAVYLDQLEELKAKSEKIPSFYDWVVGLDLFGDELGYPYCPFVARSFIEYIRKRRTGDDKGKKNERFGVRFHCGENVIFADDDSPAYRLFIAHMYIVFRCLRFLQRELKHSIRIGHGIAFSRILGEKSMSPSRHRKSSILLAEMREHANYLFKTIAFEVNITSNEYLLGRVLRQGNFSQTLRLDALFKLNVPIVLATDDDGIWPIDQCSFAHPGHHSLSAEYCRAISTSLFRLADQKDAREAEKDSVIRLKEMLRVTRNFCFCDMGGKMPEVADKDLLPPDDDRINSIIVHPNIIKLILNEYNSNAIEPNAAFENYKIYFGESSASQNNINWKNVYGSMRVAFISVCVNYIEDDKNKKEKIWQDYDYLFGKGEGGSESVKQEFEFIYNNWTKIRSEFVFFKTNNESLEAIPYVEMIQQNQKQQSQKQDVVYSEPLNSTRPLHDIFVDFLQKFGSRKVTIYAFARHMDIEKTVEAINTKVNDVGYTNQYKDVILYIFMNKDKYKYTYRRIDNRFKLQVNRKPLKRDYEKENFLYALCPHASAATAALHLISEELFSTGVHSSMPSSNNSVTNPSTTTVPHMQNRFVEAGFEEEETNKQILKRRNSEEMESGKRTSWNVEIPKQ